MHVSPSLSSSFLLSLPPFLSPSSPDIPKLASVPLQQFPAYVSSLHENENEGAEDEYQVYYNDSCILCSQDEENYELCIL